MDQAKLNTPISYGRQCIDEDDIRAVTEVMRGDFITNGPRLELFEKAVAQAVGARFAVGVSSGTMALHLAVLALELPKNFLGVTSAMTFAASANCILYGGGRLGFVDIESDVPNMSPKKLQQFCQKYSPELVIPVSFAGIPADLPRIQEIGRAKNCRIIEDASHSLGSHYLVGKERFACGSCRHSDLAVFSFHPVKNITTAEGGMITTNDQGLYLKLLSLRNHGLCKDSSKFINPEPASGNWPEAGWYYEIQELGYNGRLSELHAALGLSQFGKMASFKRKRDELVLRYNKAFSSEPSLMIPGTGSDTSCDPFFHIYTLRVKGADPMTLRLQLYTYLKKNGVLAQVHYLPLPEHPLYKKTAINSDARFDNAQDYYASVLSLPLYPALELEQQDYVISRVLEFFKGQKRS